MRARFSPIMVINVSLPMIRSPSMSLKSKTSDRKNARMNIQQNVAIFIGSICQRLLSICGTIVITVAQAKATKRSLDEGISFKPCTGQVCAYIPEQWSYGKLIQSDSQKTVNRRVSCHAGNLTPASGLY